MEDTLFKHKYTIDKGISGFSLKIIAIITMLLDHIGLSFYPEHMMFRIIGRVSFPIFCFLIVEGYFHTNNIKKYLIRLSIFAIVSEIPFDMLMSGKIIDFKYQNVLFTLIIGLMMLCAIERTLLPMNKTLWLVAAFAIAFFLRSDYTFYGVALIYIFYHFRERRDVGCLVFAVMSLVSGRIQSTAILAVPFILLYDGRKGPKLADSKICKYGFYLFYPLHVIIIDVLKMLL